MEKKSTTYEIEIYNGKKRLYPHRHYFFEEGFTFVKKRYGKSYYKKKCNSQKECTIYYEYCKQNRLKYVLYESCYLRDHSYRNRYLQQVRRNHKYLRCSYCGLYFKENKIAVDHIIPVKMAKKSKLARWLMRVLSINNINDYTNLCISCIRCNQRKGTKMGLWLIRGYLGKINWLWHLRWSIRFALLLTLIGLFVQT